MGELAILVPSMRVGGTERQVVELARGMAAAEQALTVVLMERQGDLLAELNGLGVDVVDLGGGGARRILTHIVRLRRLAEARNISTVYSFLSPANFSASLMRLAKRDTDVVWGIRDDRIGAERRGVGRQLARLLTRTLVGMARGVVVNGYSVRDALVREGFAPERVRVVPNAIDQTRFRPDAELRTLTRRELDLSDTTPVVLTLARLAPKKRHRDALEAFFLVIRRVPDAVLLIAGSGDAEYVSLLKARATALGIHPQVRFLGERHDAERLLNAADVSLVMSEAEGFPNSVAESLATGTPCVSTNVGDVAALVASDDLIPVGDVTAAADAICRHLASTRSNIDNLLPAAFGQSALVVNTLEALRSLGCRFGDHSSIA